MFGGKSDTLCANEHFVPKVSLYNVQRINAFNTRIKGVIKNFQERIKNFQVAIALTYIVSWTVLNPIPVGLTHIQVCVTQPYMDNFF